MKIAFPYMDMNAKEVKKESIDDLFDQLDAIIAKNKEQNNDSDTTGEDVNGAETPANV